jgi:serine/threonine protein kinase
VEENNQSMTVYKVLYDPTVEKTKLGMSIEDWLRICYDIADGLDHMHQKGYLHCDLKTNNVLISKKRAISLTLVKYARLHTLLPKSTKNSLAILHQRYFKILLRPGAHIRTKFGGCRMFWDRLL